MRRATYAAARSRPVRQQSAVRRHMATAAWQARSEKRHAANKRRQPTKWPAIRQIHPCYAGIGEIKSRQPAQPWPRNDEVRRGTPSCQPYNKITKSTQPPCHICGVTYTVRRCPWQQQLLAAAIACAMSGGPPCAANALTTGVSLPPWPAAAMRRPPRPASAPRGTAPRPCPCSRAR